MREEDLTNLNDWNIYCMYVTLRGVGYITWIFDSVSWGITLCQALNLLWCNFNFNDYLDNQHRSLQNYNGIITKQKAEWVMNSYVVARNSDVWFLYIYNDFNVLIGEEFSERLEQFKLICIAQCFSVAGLICFYYIKYSVFIRISGTDKTDNLTCEIIYDNFTCENYRFSNNHQSKLRYTLYWWKTCSLYNKQKNTWVLGNTRFISRVEHYISRYHVQHSK